MTFLTLPNLAAWSAQVALIVGAALLSLRMLRLDAPAVRYTLLRAVLAVCLLAPLLQARQPLARPGARASADLGGARLASAADEDRDAPALGSPLAPLALPLRLVVATGTALRLLWIGAGLVRLRRLRRAGQATAGIGEHDELQALLGTRAAVRYVPQLGQPVTFGFRHPVVLLPDSLRRKAPAIQRAVLAHELWHVRRRDWMWTVAEEAVRAMLWFHPAIWILLAQIQSSREEAVDELTVLATGSRRSYLDALFAFADEPPLFAATAFARRRHLVRRMVLISKEAVMSGRHVAVCTTTLALVVGASGWYGTQAFPLRQGADSAQTLTDKPGPLESQAKAITPENPMPRRIAAAAAEYPAEAAGLGANGTVTVRATLDQFGHVAEARAVGASLRLRNRAAAVHVSSARPETIERFLDASVLPSGNGTTEQQRESLRAMLAAVSRSATDAVSSWTYAEPADAPIAFFVTVPFGPAEAAAAPPPPPPPPAPRPAVGAATAPRPGPGGPATGAPAALRVGAGIAPPAKVLHVNPVYPADARAQQIQGVVILETRIGTDGAVEDAKVLRSIPLLDQAAVDAVRQWRFAPTLLNGQPVPLIMIVTVNFSLQ